MPPWVELWPGRLAYELDELERAGISYRRNDVAFEAGIAQIQVEVESDGEQLDLVVVFPDLYPEVRFEVFAPDLDLEHHQNPFSKNICLIGRDTANWRPSDTLAAFLRDQLPKALHSGRSTDGADVAQIEEAQAEPFSDYYHYQPSAMLLVDSGWVIDPTVPKGTLRIAIEGEAPGIHGAVLEISGEDGTILASVSDVIKQRYADLPTIHGRWIRCDTEVRAEAEGFPRELSAHDSRILNPQWQPVGGHRLPLIDVVGVIFPEETTWRQTADGWVFLERVRRDKHRPPQPYLVRAGYAGSQDLTERIPELGALPDRKVAIFGLGALGMPSAIALARAGIGELRALDSDFVDPGTTSRWPLGLSAAGREKTAVLKDFLAAEYPYTKVTSFVHRLGSTRGPGAVSDISVLESMLDGADLVFDATAEEGLHPILERLSRERGIPYVCVSGTNGAWGGTVVRTRPETGCWRCFLAGQLDGTVPIPIAGPASYVQPAGCGSPTFTGAGFDLEQIAVLGVRVAVGTLTHAAEGYPDAAWDVAIGDFRDQNGALIAPRWQQMSLTRQPRCPACAK